MPVMPDGNADTLVPDASPSLPAGRRTGAAERPALRALLSLACLMTLGGAVVLLWSAEVERGEARAALARVNEAKRLAARAEELVDAEVDRARTLVDAMVAAVARREKWDQGRFTAAVERLAPRRPRPAA